MVHFLQVWMWDVKEDYNHFEPCKDPASASLAPNPPLASITPDQPDCHCSDPRFGPSWVRQSLELEKDFRFQ